MVVFMFVLFLFFQEKLKEANEVCNKSSLEFWSCCKEKHFPSECVSQYKSCLLASSLTDVECKYYSLENASFKNRTKHLEENCDSACNYSGGDNSDFPWCLSHDYPIYDSCPYKVGYSEILSDFWHCCRRDQFYNESDNCKAFKSVCMQSGNASECVQSCKVYPRWEFCEIQENLHKCKSKISENETNGEEFWKCCKDNHDDIECFEQNFDCFVYFSELRDSSYMTEDEKAEFLAYLKDHCNDACVKYNVNYLWCSNKNYSEEDQCEIDFENENFNEINSCCKSNNHSFFCDEMNSICSFRENEKICQTACYFDIDLELCEKTNEKTYCDDVTKSFGDGNRAIFWKCCKSAINEVSCNREISQCEAIFSFNDEQTKEFFGPDSFLTKEDYLNGNCNMGCYYESNNEYKWCNISGGPTPSKTETILVSTTSSTLSNPIESGLSGGAVAGIIILVLVLCGVVVILLYCLIIKKHFRSSKQSSGFGVVQSSVLNY